jgi:polysaccharide pyruvyl transferase WcaK-like protein
MKKVLLAGYHGFNNCGADARLEIILQDLKKINKEIEITILTFFKPKRKINGIKYLQVSLISFYIKFNFIIKNFDCVIIDEGIPFNDSWSNFYYNYFLFCIKLAKKNNKKVIFYSIDCDKLKKSNQKKIKYYLNNYSDLIVTRSDLSYDYLKKMGVKSSILVKDADPTFLIKESNKKIKLFDNNNQIVAFSIKNFYGYPMKLNFFGKKENLYHYPFYFSCNNQKACNNFVIQIAKIVDKIISKYNYNIIFIEMEPNIDWKINCDIINKVKYKNNVKIVSYNKYSANKIKKILSSVKLLISSRLHTILFSLEYTFPIIGIGADNRFLCLKQELKDNFSFINRKDNNFLNKLNKEIEKKLKLKKPNVYLKKYFINKRNEANNNYKLIEGIIND